MKKVLHIAGIRNGWAITGRAKALAAAMADKFDCTVMSTDDSPPPADTFDLIHVHSLVLLPHVPTYYLSHPCWGFEVVSLRSLRYLPKTREAIQAASFCVSKSPELQKEMTKHLAPQTKTAWIPNGVDCRTFGPRRFRVGWVGRKEDSYKRFKGFYLAEEAVEILNRRWSGMIKAEFVPDPSRYPIKMLSRVEMAEYYRSLDAFVVASESEGSSNVLMEALAAGLGVVSTDVGCVREIAKNANVHIVERAAEAIADALETIAAPAAGRVDAMWKNYDWRQIAKQYSQLYREVFSW